MINSKKKFSEKFGLVLPENKKLQNMRQRGKWPYAKFEPMWAGLWRLVISQIIGWVISFCEFFNNSFLKNENFNESKVLVVVIDELLPAFGQLEDALLVPGVRVRPEEQSERCPDLLGIREVV